MKNISRIQSKIITIDQFEKLVDKSKKIVFTNGCFDIIHLGHIEYLAAASDLGDIFVIGVNTDESVSRIKGENRPIQDEKSRTITLAAFEFVDYIILFNENTPLSLISEITPDILIKGSDYNISDIIGSEVVIENGGEVKTIDFVDGYSTSLVIEKIKSTYN